MCIDITLQYFNAKKNGNALFIKAVSLTIAGESLCPITVAADLW